MEIGSRIKILRENARLTQIELAQILKINNSTLSQYENGVRIPSDDIKISIANYFDVSLDYLLGRTNNKAPTLVPEDGLNEAEQSMLNLFRLVPVKDQGMVTQMIEAALRSRELL